MNALLKNDARKHLVDVQGFKGVHVDEFLDCVDFEKLIDEGEINYPDLVIQYKEFRAYTLYEIEKIIGELFVFHPILVVDYMGECEQLRTFSGFNGFFPEAEKEGMSIERIITKAVISMIEAKYAKEDS